MQTPIIWGEPETSYIRRFMDGVDKVVTDEMQSGRSLLEESLTFVLARLLDGQFCWFNRSTERSRRSLQWVNQHRQLYRFFPLRSSRPLR